MNIALQELGPSTGVWDLVCGEGDKGDGRLPRAGPSGRFASSGFKLQASGLRTQVVVSVKSAGARGTSGSKRPWCESNLREVGGCNHDGYERVVLLRCLTRPAFPSLSCHPSSIPTNLTLRPPRPQDTPKEVTRGLTTRRSTLFVEREELRPLPSTSTHGPAAPPPPIPKSTSGQD